MPNYNRNSRPTIMKKPYSSNRSTYGKSSISQTSNNAYSMYSRPGQPTPSIRKKQMMSNGNQKPIIPQRITNTNRSVVKPAIGNHQLMIDWCMVVGHQTLPECINESMDTAPDKDRP